MIILLPTEASRSTIKEVGTTAMPLGAPLRVVADEVIVVLASSPRGTVVQ